jgi:DNA-directed RNA polymerase
VRQIESQLPVGVKLPPPPAYGNLDIGVIRQSKYFFS